MTNTLPLARGVGYSYQGGGGTCC